MKNNIFEFFLKIWSLTEPNNVQQSMLSTSPSEIRLLLLLL